MKMLLIKWFAPRKYDKIMADQWIEKFHKRVRYTDLCECEYEIYRLGLPTSNYKKHLDVVRVMLRLRKEVLGKDCWK